MSTSITPLTKLWPLTPRSLKSEVERIWYKDPRGFFHEDRLTHIIPEPTTGLDSQLNSIMRFALYLAVFVVVYRRSITSALKILTLAALFTFAIHYADAEKMNAHQESMANLDLQIDPATRRMCTTPTKENPYMNFLLSDYTRFPNRPKACDITRTEVKDKAEDLANHNLYADSDDIYGRRVGSSWQFVTNATTQAMTDQSEFARWLYQPSPEGTGTCREGNGDACASKLFSMYPGV